MAFPSVAGTGTLYSTAGSNATSHVVDLPASIASGDLLIIVGSVDGNVATVSASGWTVRQDDVSDAGNARGTLLYKIADGTEGASVTITTDLEQALFQAFRITGWHGTTVPEVSLDNVNQGLQTDVVHPDLTPSWGAADTLWVCFAAFDVDIGTVSQYALTDNNIVGNTGGSGHCGLVVSTQGINTATLTGKTTIQSRTSRGVAAYSVAIRPAAGSSTQTVSLNAVASTTAVGQPTVTPGGVTVDASGVASASAVGQPTVTTRTTVDLSGVASATAVGQPTITTGPVTVDLSGVASTAAVGQPTVSQAGGAQTVDLNGIASSSAVGQPTLTPGPTTVSLNGVASASAVGQPTVVPGAVTVTPNGVASTSAVGQPTVTFFSTVSPTGIASAAAVGQPTITTGSVTVSLNGIASTTAVGQPAVAEGTFTFTPPLAAGRRLGHEGTFTRTKQLQRRMQTTPVQRGQNVYILAGVAHIARGEIPAAADYVYLGGHTYTVTGAERDILVAAGFME